MSALALSKSNSSPNKPKININGRTVGLVVGSLSVLLVGFAVFQIYSIFQQALDVKIENNNSGQNFFNKQTIKEIRHIHQNTNNISIPEGRISPFKT